VSRRDLHVHSIYSTDSGNYALRRAPHRPPSGPLGRGDDPVPRGRRAAARPRLEPGRGGSPRPAALLPVGLRARRLPARPRAAHALAHPLYRMGPPLTRSHIERMMLLFSVWEGRNGARPQQANELACRLAAHAEPALLATLAERHGIASSARRPDRAQRRLRRPRRARRRDDVHRGPRRDAGRVPDSARRGRGAAPGRPRLDHEARPCGRGALRQRVPRLGCGAAGHGAGAGRAALRP